MRFTILFLAIFLFFSPNIAAQNVAKTITFNGVTISAGSPYINADPSAGDNEDFGLLIRCTTNSLFFAGDWTSTTDVTAAGTYTFGLIFSDCAAANMVLEPIDPALNSITLDIETFESGDLDCDGPYNPGGSSNNDEFQEVSNGVSLDISDGSHSFTQTLSGVTYNYTVTSAPTAATGLICGQDLTAAADVPTLSQWGLITLALLLMTAGTLHLVQPSVSREDV